MNQSTVQARYGASKPRRVLAYDAVYYWRVIARDYSGGAFPCSSVVYSFSTCQDISCTDFTWSSLPGTLDLDVDDITMGQGIRISDSGTHPGNYEDYYYFAIKMHPRVVETGQYLEDIAFHELTPYEDGEDIGDEKIMDLDEDLRVQMALVLDMRYSMEEAGAIDSLCSAAATFCENIDTQFHRVALIRFASEINLMHDFTSNPQSLLSSLASQCGLYGVHTSLYDACDFGIERLISAGDADERILIAFTDGRDNRSVLTVGAVADRIDEQGLVSYTIGLGDQISESDLESLARNGGNYLHAPTAEELEEIFVEISERTHHTWHLVYVTPKQQGTGVHELRLRLERDGRVGDIVIDFEI